MVQLLLLSPAIRTDISSPFISTCSATIFNLLKMLCEYWVHWPLVIHLQNEWFAIAMYSKKNFKSFLRRAHDCIISYQIANVRICLSLCFLPSLQNLKCFFCWLENYRENILCQYAHISKNKKYLWIPFKMLSEIVQNSTCRPVEVHNTKICNSLNTYYFSFCKSLFWKCEYNSFSGKKTQTNKVTSFLWNIADVPRCHSSHE